MSIKVMNWVWQNSTTKGSERLVLLALADNADDAGQCYPGLDYLARKCNLSRRFVIVILKKLEGYNEETKKMDLPSHIERERRGGKRTIYIIKMGDSPVNPDSPVNHDSRVNSDSPRGEPGLTPRGEPGLTIGVNPASPEPSVNHQFKPSGEPFNRKKRAPKSCDTIPKEILQPIIDALARATLMDSALNYPRIAKDAKALIKAGYTAQQIDEVYKPGGAWWLCDWRGQKGQRPLLSQIGETIKGLLNGEVRKPEPAGFGGLRDFSNKHGIGQNGNTSRDT